MHLLWISNVLYVFCFNLSLMNYQIQGIVSFDGHYVFVFWWSYIRQQVFRTVSDKLSRVNQILSSSFYWLSLSAPYYGLSSDSKMIFSLTLKSCFIIINPPMSLSIVLIAQSGLVSCVTTFLRKRVELLIVLFHFFWCFHIYNEIHNYRWLQEKYKNSMLC